MNERFKQFLRTYGECLSLPLLAVFFGYFLWKGGFYTFSYQSEWHAAVFRPNWFVRAMTHPGGVANALADALCATYDAPWTGVVTNALILAVIAAIHLYAVRKTAGVVKWATLCVLPSLGLMFLQFQPNALYAATTSFGMASLMLWLTLRWMDDCREAVGTWYGWVYLTTAFLYVAAGPVALLYAFWLVILEVRALPKGRRWPLVLLPLFVGALAFLYLYQGEAGDLRPLLTPEAYYTLRLPAIDLVYLPAGVSLILMALAQVESLKQRWLQRPWKGGSILAFNLVLLALIMYGGLQGVRRHTDANGLFFQRLSVYATHGDTKAIRRACRQYPMDNLLFQNYLNMALAEEGRLADELFEEPCLDIRTIYVQGDKTPYVSGMLSDIYFSMGHIALAQRYAFEANEGMDNRSPRMLRRLVQTNLIYGAYAVARKYLDVLAAMPCQGQWVERHRRFLDHDEAVEADSLLGLKRRCLFPDNRFAGSRGLDDDLRQILLVNPRHRPTMLYLGCLYLLSKDLPRFRQTLDTFYDTEALPAGTLPVAFQEAVRWMAQDDPSLAERYPVSPEVEARWVRFQEKPRQQPHSFWYYMKYRR
jgi:hypothetical protein